MQSPSKPASLREYAVLAGILVTTFAVLSLSPVTTSTDSAWTFHIATSILREHNVDLNEYRPIINLQLDYRMRVIGGHIYSYYPVATPLLVTPAVWLVNEIYPLTHRTDFYAYLAQHAPDVRTANLEKLIASAIVAPFGRNPVPDRAAPAASAWVTGCNLDIRLRNVDVVYRQPGALATRPISAFPQRRPVFDFCLLPTEHLSSFGSD